jgi:hypothetical protein
VRTQPEIDRVLGLALDGLGASAIARRTGIPRATVRDWLDGRIPRRAPSGGRPAVPPAPYSRLLGLYLGDGHVVRLRRTYMLRIFFDARYPGLIAAGVRTVRAVAPEQRVTVFRRAPTNCVVIRCYWNAWPLVFPQHGPGRKHERPITLATWQRSITHANPQEFVRGLLDSDGCRFTNPVRYGERRYAYPRYFFTNASADIRALFCEHLDLLGIAWRRVGERNISIARREAVAALDAFIGPKR